MGKIWVIDANLAHILPATLKMSSVVYLLKFTITYNWNIFAVFLKTFWPNKSPIIAFHYFSHFLDSFYKI